MPLNPAGGAEQRWRQLPALARRSVLDPPPSKPAMQRLALGRLSMRLSVVHGAPLRAAALAPVRTPAAAAARRSVRVLASAANGSSPNGPSKLGASGSGADGAIVAQQRQLAMQSFARQHGAAASADVGAAAAAAAAAVGSQQRRGVLRRLLLSGAAAVALLAAATWPRPAAAFQGPVGMFGGGRPPAVEAVPVTMENKVRAEPGIGYMMLAWLSVLVDASSSHAFDQLLPTLCHAVQTPLPDLSQLSPDEVLTIELFRINT